MHTSDLVAQVTSIVVAAVAMVIAWLFTRRCPNPAPPAPPADPHTGTDAERPL
ncbi:hypothetical protein ACLGIH_19880 [Streptomyces sp. HMX87]|uniref:hypothetical protein n=1 Tax=Streptomyces sp. HMX87 TaxID=3390849 RepID=UPI003A86F67D